MSNEYFALDANVAALAQAFGEDMGDVKRRILKDATTFPTRVEMVAALPTLADSPDGRIVFANGEGYMRDRDSSAIPDMPGWKRWEPIPGVINASDIVSYGEQSPDPAKQAQARQNLGLGTASTHSEDDFATSEQGEKADAAVSYEAQSASEPEKDQARQNLGLGTMSLVDDEDVRPVLGFTVRVPSDYPTVQQALDATRQKLLASNVEVTILIEAGHELTHGWTIEGGDWSQYVIRSEDSVVRTVQTGFVPVVVSNVPGSSQAIISYVNCRAPTLATVIEGRDESEFSGLVCFSNVSLEVLSGCGVKNTDMNFEMRQGGSLSANGSVWQDSRRENMRLTNGVVFSISGAKFGRGWTAWDSSIAYTASDLRVSRACFGQAQDLTIEDSGARCVTIARSYVSIKGSVLSGAGTVTGSPYSVHLMEGSVVSAEGVTCNGSAMQESDVGPAGTVFNAAFRINGTIYANSSENIYPLKGDTVEDARFNLGLQKVVHNKDTTSGRVLTVGYGGLGGITTGYEGDDLDTIINTGSKFFHGNNNSVNIPFAWPIGIHLERGTDRGAQIAFQSLGSSVRGAFRVVDSSSNSWSTWAEILSTANTTVDANGFIKEASPVVKVFEDCIETNDDAGRQSIEFERVSEGIYILSNTSGLAQNGWRVEVPQDVNGNRLLHVTLTEEDGTITLETREPTWVNGQLDGGNPLDIPEGRWIDIRLQETGEDS